MTTARYGALQTLSFEVSRLDWTASYHELAVPERWKAPLRDIAKVGRKGEPAAIPIRGLNDAITSLMPDVVAVASEAWVAQRRPWIYSSASIPRDALFAVCAAWVRSQPPPLPLIEAALHAMSPDDLEWTEVSVHFGRLASEGAAADERAMLFRLLPHELAARLSAPGVAHEHGAHGLSAFRRSPVGSGAQIVSWPPHERRTKPFSYTLTISAQTRPFNRKTFIHIDVGVRRWVHRSPSLNGNSHSVYMLPSVPWIDGTLTRSFHRLTLAASRRPGPREEFEATWAETSRRVLTELGCEGRLPNAADLCRDPLTWLTRDQDAAALVYQPGMFQGRDHPVSSGVSVRDRDGLLTWTSSLLAPELNLQGPLPRAPRDSEARPVRPSRPVKSTEPKGRELRLGMARSLGHTVKLEILYDSTQTLRVALSTLADQLGVPEPSVTSARSVHEIPTDEVTVRLHVEPVGAIGASLEPPSSGPMLERIRQAAEARSIEISGRFAPADGPIGTLVEIAGKDAYKGRARIRDPKFATRLGLARRGRNTQFLTVSTDEAHGDDASAQDVERLKHAWLDLFRQMGVRDTPFGDARTPAAVPSGMMYLAIWLIRQNRRQMRGVTRQVPVAVLLDAGCTDVRLCTPAIQWTSYREGLLGAAVRHTLGGQPRGSDQVGRFVEATVRGVVNSYADTLLLTASQNLRAAWPGVANTNLTKDHIRFGASDPIPITQLRGLRHLLVRTDEDHETPECFAVHESEGERTYGHSRGLWKLDGDRVFASTADKPVTASAAVKGASKLQPRIDRHGGERPPTPRGMVWNAQLVEITAAALQPGDDPAEWAGRAHDLRWAASHHDGALTYPWPLHLAKQVSEYVLPLEIIEAVADDARQNAGH